MKEEEEKKTKTTEEKKRLNTIAKFSGMGFQMAAIIGGGVYLGHWFDEKNTREFPLYTLIIGLFSIFAALYLTLKELIKNDK